MHRFFQADFDIHASTIKLSKENRFIASKVLRLKDGAPIVLLNGQGAVASLVFDSQSSCSLENIFLAPKAKNTCALAQANVKGDKATFIVQKATELGLAKVIFFASQHAEGKPKKDKFLAKLQKTSMEALRQSGNPYLPEISLLPSLAEVFKDQADVAKLYADENRQGKPLLQALGLKSTMLFVGPEGGWSNAEREIFQKNAVENVVMTSYVLRCETAAVAGMAAMALHLHK